MPFDRYSMVLASMMEDVMEAERRLDDLHSKLKKEGENLGLTKTVHSLWDVTIEVENAIYAEIERYEKEEL